MSSVPSSSSSDLIFYPLPRVRCIPATLVFFPCRCVSGCFLPLDLCPCGSDLPRWHFLAWLHGCFFLSLSSPVTPAFLTTQSPGATPLPHSFSYPMPYFILESCLLSLFLPVGGGPRLSCSLLNALGEDLRPVSAQDIVGE